MQEEYLEVKADNTTKKLSWLIALTDELSDKPQYTPLALHWAQIGFVAAIQAKSGEEKLREEIADFLLDNKIEVGHDPEGKNFYFYLNNFKGEKPYILLAGPLTDKNFDDEQCDAMAGAVCCGFINGASVLTGKDYAALVEAAKIANEL